MSTLAIFDVRAFLHSVKDVDVYKHKTQAGFHFGGIEYLAKYMCLEIRKGYDICLCSDSKTNRKLIDSGYKGNRVLDPFILSQDEVLANMIPKCGIPYLQEEGYEADDLIYHVIKRNYNKYDKIIILGNDIDLSANIDINDRVRLESISSNVSNVNKDNFSVSVVKGKFIPFNFIQIYKILNGDRSDNIKPFKTISGVRGSKIFEKYTIMSMKDKENCYKYSSIKVFLEFMLDDSNGFGMVKKDIDNLVVNAKLVLPNSKSLDSFDETMTDFSKFNKSRFIDFLSAFRLNEHCDLLGAYARPVNGDTLNYFRSLAKKVNSGEYAVDRSVTINTSDAFVNKNSFVVKSFV